MTFMYADGCNARAQERLYGDLKTWMVANLVAANLATDIDRYLLADPKVTSANDAWKRCMSGAGHSYPNPARARSAALDGYVRGRGSADETRQRELRQREIKIAVADATCDKKTGRARLIRGLDPRYRERAARENAREIATYRERRDEALASLRGGQ
ncbi:hypothetical protein RB200_05760 [Streptomyces sp. PmtG]